MIKYLLLLNVSRIFSYEITYNTSILFLSLKYDSIYNSNQTKPLFNGMENFLMWWLSLEKKNNNDP